MLLMWGISKAIQLIGDCANASDRLKDSAKELGNSFSSTKSEISSYKEKIEDLYKTINDSSSSYEDTYTARQNLLSIQDEMITKFGDEAKAVKLVTEAINGQTDSLDALTADKWQEIKNSFNSDVDKSWTENLGDAWANFWSGSSNNFDRMINEIENTEVRFYMPHLYGNKTYEEFSDKLKENFGASLTRTEYDDIFTLSGDLDDIYKQLLNIQSLASDMGIEESFLTDLSRQADSTKKTLENYEEIYNQYILYDKILDNETYKASFNKINEAYSKYQNVFATGDEKAIANAKQSFAEVVQEATNGINDQSIINYFNSMYPVLQEAVGSWEFEVHFKAAIENDSDDFEEDVKGALGSFGTAEELRDYSSKVKAIDYNTATEEQKQMIDNYYLLDEIADKYSLTMEQLINKMVQMGLIQSQAKIDLLDKLIPSRTELTAGIQTVLNNAIAGVDPDVATGWVESLTEEETILANSKEFEQALEEQKDKINGATLSADDYEAALQNVKSAQEQLDSDTLSISTFLSNSQDAVTGFTSSLKSAHDAYNALLSPDVSPSDTLNSILEMNEAIKAMEGKINWEFLGDIPEADRLNSLGIVLDNISQQVGDKLKSSLYSGNAAYDTFIDTIVDGMVQQQKAASEFSSMNSQLDSLQSSYQTLSGILDSYNSTGRLTLDNLQSLLTADSNLISMLDVENGRLVINEQAYKSLITTQLLAFDAKLADAEAAEIAALANSSAKASIEGQGNSTDSAADSIRKHTRALDEDSAAAIANAEANALENGASQEDIDAIKEKYDKVRSAIWETFGSDTGSFLGKSASGSSDRIREAFDREYSSLKHHLEMGQITEKQYYDSLSQLNEKYFAGKDEYLDDYRSYEEEIYRGLLDYYKNYVESSLSLLEAQLDSGIINYQHYSSTVQSLLTTMYADGRLSAEDYHSYIRQMLEKQLSVYDSVLSAVSSRFDKEIDYYDQLIGKTEQANDALEQQKEDYDTILSVIDSVYESEIQSLEAQQDAIDEKIQSLQDANAEEERSIALTKARYELERARNQRVNRVYVEGQGFVYQADRDAIRDAQESLDSAELEDTIARLEAERDAFDPLIAVLEEYRRKWADISSTRETELHRQLAISLFGQDYERIILLNRTEDIENFKNNYLLIQSQIDDNTSLIDSYQEKTEYYNALKEQWSGITDVYQSSINEQYAAMLLGQSWEQDILSGRLDTLTDFKNRYIALQQEIANAQTALSQAALTEPAVSGASVSGASVSGASVSEAASSADSSPAGTKNVQNSLRKQQDNDAPNSETTKYALYDIRTGQLLAAGFSDEKDASRHIRDVAAEAQGEGYVQIREYHNGLAAGYVGQEQLSDEKLALLRAAGSNISNGSTLKLNELPGILQKGELVLTARQQENISNVLKNFSLTSYIPLNLPLIPQINLEAMHNNSTPVVQNITLSLPNVTNSNGAEYIKRELQKLPMQALQFANRR